LEIGWWVVVLVALIGSCKCCCGTTTQKNRIVSRRPQPTELSNFTAHIESGRRSGRPIKGPNVK
jgi:hypothetical protein